MDLVVQVQFFENCSASPPRYEAAQVPFWDDTPLLPTATNGIARLKRTGLALGPIQELPLVLQVPLGQGRLSSVAFSTCRNANKQQTSYGEARRTTFIRTQPAIRGYLPVKAPLQASRVSCEPSKVCDLLSRSTRSSVAPNTIPTSPLPSPSTCTMRSFA